MAANFFSIVVLPLLVWFGRLVITILGAFGDYFLYRVCFAIDVARDKFLPLEYVLAPFCALFSLGHGFLTSMGVPLSEGDLLVLLLYLSLAVCFRGYLWSAVVCWAKIILGLLVNYSGLILRLCMLSAEFGVYVPPVARACLVVAKQFRWRTLEERLENFLRDPIVDLGPLPFTGRRGTTPWTFVASCPRTAQPADE